MDIKAGYHNVRCTPRTSDVLGIVTQDGLFKWVRMPFGPQQAPACFQYIMDTVLHDIKGVRSYLDDLKTQGNSWQQCWAATINVFRALTAAGFKINLRKCKLLVHQCTLLGCWVSKSQIALGDKYLRGLVGLQVPTTWKELQSLLGKLLWASPFLPNYKRLIAPIEALLGAKGEVRWTQECTTSLNAIIAMIFLRLRVSTPDDKLPYRLYPDFDSKFSLAALT